MNPQEVHTSFCIKIDQKHTNNILRAQFDFNVNDAVPGAVFDIGGRNLDSYYKSLLDTTLLKRQKWQQRVLPRAVLYNDIGLQIWSRITLLPDYYQTRDEIDLLEHHSAEIAEHVVEGCTLFDLGSG